MRELDDGTSAGRRSNFPTRVQLCAMRSHEKLRNVSEIPNRSQRLYITRKSAVHGTSRESKSSRFFTTLAVRSG